MNNLEKIKKFIELRSSGYSLNDISGIIGLSKRSLIKWNKKYCSVVFEVQSEELKEFKKKLLNDKLSRLNFLNSKFEGLKEKIDKAEIIMRYDRMLLLLMKVSKSIDDCQKNIILSEISEKIDELDKNEIAKEINAEENLEKQKENT
jgi:hypothetical protein